MSTQNSTSNSTIEVRGIRVHNLKNVDVEIPRGQLIAVCGVSGSGKTSLAIDTLYAEGQRRYIESFSAYSRQFLDRLDKPDFDSATGLPPALAVTRAAASKGNRSTVGSASETLDYLRLLFAKIAKVVCHKCGKPVTSHDPQTVAKIIQQLPSSLRLMIGFRVEWSDIGERSDILADLQASGFIRLISNGSQLSLSSDSREELAQSLPKAGSILVIVDRLRGGDEPSRTLESLETAYTSADDFQSPGGGVSLLLEEEAVETLASTLAASLPEPTKLAVSNKAWGEIVFCRSVRCATCDITYPKAEARLFSFNSPLGACEKCEGFGDTIDLDIDLVVPDNTLSIREGAIACWNGPAYSHNLDELLDIADELDIPVDIPFKKLSKKQVSALWEGDETSGYGGVVGFFNWLERKKYKMHVRVFLSRWRSYNTCDACQGARLNPLALAYRVAGQNLAELCDQTVDDLLDFILSAQLDPREKTIAKIPFGQLESRLKYLQTVGLGYLTLGRTLRTLSGGETQRTTLSSALGSSLVNVLYVLDEPSVGLHPHDVENLAQAIVKLTDRNNTVLIIEHEEALLERADWLIEVGPAAGSQGGEIVFCGPKKDLESHNTLTGDYLSGKRSIPVPATKRSPSGWIKLKGCQGNNLKSIDVDFPLGVFCVVTGVSGSGKSSLVQDTLFRAVDKRLSVSSGSKRKKDSAKPLKFKSISGLGQIDECVLVDQSPVSRSPRSNPVTYVKAFDEIRSEFASTVDARVRNFTSSHFSFNSEQGRCPTCSGDGALQIDMQFLADIFMTCPDCHGKRYRPEILSVRYRDRTIADVLQMTVNDAIGFFRGAAKTQVKLQVLRDVGLDYLQLGQPATTLSSGEAQRLKLAAHLANASKQKTLFILDEPTTGLHTADIVKLLSCFDALLASGNSLLVVEHNLHLMRAADHLIDLGPGPAESGGEVVAAGTPEKVAKCKASVTARYL